MKRILALALAITAGSAAFASESAPADVKDQITAKLTEQGYEVRKVKSEDGMFEAYAMKDGDRFEIYFDKDLNVIEGKSDD